ncbi:MAG TPA: HlyD family efflux transporter periplasmic adaptor subunit [Leucothrix mucor]|uniref:HlyD family efflux transporter periplasmic adaptor subunit n=1 Tax=Leucothrix mucor TaxID=45248 RepID=A0A7V2WVH0_LEUMU|nr:HlyD family efflux transporter periplasmic adaptor subunit [Leucothrix mucor]
MIKFLLNLIMFLIMIAIGVVAFKNMQGKKKEVVHEEIVMEAKLVDVIRIKKRPFSASVTAYGNVQPTVVFQGKSEVSGKVTYVHPRLKRGANIAAGTVVVRINPVDYKLSLDKNRSDLAASKSQLEQLMQERASTRSSLKLAKANLRLGLQELQRIRTIFNRRLIARSTLDAEEQKVLQLRQKVSDTQGKLNTYTSRIKNAKAKIKRSLQQVEGGKTTLGRTQVKIPFDARISVANLDKGEIINAGSVLFEAINTDAVEINAELSIKQMQRLLSAAQGKSTPLKAANSNQHLKNLALKAQVKLVGGNDQAVWTGRVVRFSESVDPTRHTTAVTVVVDHPDQNTITTGRPPLLKGMYVAVELSAPAYYAIIIPRKAIHSGRAFIVNQEQKLEIRTLEIQSRQGNVAIIRKGLNVGEQLIVNDLVPVIKGMPLKALIKQQDTK